MGELTDTTTNSAAGAVGAAGSSVLVAIDDAHFGPAGVSMEGNVVLICSQDATNSVAAIAGEPTLQSFEQLHTETGVKKITFENCSASLGVVSGQFEIGLKMM